MLRAAIYARYSSENQREHSLEDQIRLCRRAAPRFRCEVAEDHVYRDAAISGATNQRSGYQALMAVAKAKRFDAILVESQDRLWRDQAEMHDALKRLRFWNVRVFTVDTGTDLTDKSGGIIASVVGWQSEAFLDNLREKTLRGMEGRVRQGYSPGGRAYGYRSVAELDDAGQVSGYRLVIDEAEAKVVRRIFEKYANGMSPKSIAHKLNEERVPQPRWRRRAPNRGWTKSTIHGSQSKATGILNNPLYIGRVVWNRSQKVRDPDTGKRVTRRRDRSEWVEAEVPKLRIVPDDLWKRVQAKRKATRETFRRRHRQPCGHPPRYLFSGLLVCGACGAHYIIKSGRYYGCASTINRGSAICSNTRLARRDVVEDRIIRAVEEQVFSPTAVAYLMRKVNEALHRASSRSTSKRRSLEAELRRAEREAANIKQAVRHGKATATLLDMLEETEARKARLKAELAQPLDPHPSEVLPSLVKRYLKDLRGSLGRDTERARAILRDLVGEINLEPDDEGLIAVLRGNVQGILGLRYDNDGAGRGI